jgi:transposase
VTSAAPAEHLEQDPSAVSALLSRLEAERDEALASRDKALAECGKALAECDRLRSAHDRLREELQCLKRRIFVAKAERVDVSQLELEFAMRSAELAALASERGTGADDPPPPPPRRSKPRGRRRIEDMDALPVEDLAPSESEPVPDSMRLTCT